jgi:hypothetical protein
MRGPCFAPLCQWYYYMPVAAQPQLWPSLNCPFIGESRTNAYMWPLRTLLTHCTTTLPVIFG